MSEMLMETYLRQQVDKGEYGVAIIQAQIALDIADYIEKQRQPTIEPERKKGKWITQQFGSWAECSECHELYDIPIANSNFCPNCGADMRGEQNDE